MDFDFIGTFIFTFLTGGGLVWADIGLLMATIWVFLSHNAKENIALWGTFSHAICGTIGLVLFYLGGVYWAESIGNIFVIIAAYVGLCFTSHGLQEGDDDESEVVEILKQGAFIAVMVKLLPVSIDELYAILQKTQWMQNQGWSFTMIVLNFILSMITLFFMLKATSKALDRGKYAQWAKKNGDLLMFGAHSLINYYVIRAILQNLLELDGWFFWEVPFTGIAALVLGLSVFATLILKELLKKPKFASKWNFVFRELA